MPSLAFTLLHGRRCVERVVNVRAILAALPETTVVEDTPDEESVMQRTRGCWPLARRAWSRDVGGATHHLVLEDDAVLCERFAERALEAVRRAPDAVIVYYYGWRGCSVATSWPAAHIAEWVAWVDGERYTHHDAAQTHGARALGLELLFAFPGLVNHGSFPSHLGHGFDRADSFDHDPEHFDLRGVRL